MFDFVDKEKDNYYCCVIHNRIRGAMRRLSDPPPAKRYAVAFNGKIKGKSFVCSDDGQYLRVEIAPDKLVLKFKTHEEEVPYKMNEICCYNVPIFDAMESWEFVISETPIDNEMLKPGYKKGSDGIYYKKDNKSLFSRKK